MSLKTSPSRKLLFAIIIAVILIIALFIIFLLLFLNSKQEIKNQEAQQSITLEAIIDGFAIPAQENLGVNIENVKKGLAEKN
jgi:flagellar basal body-associated protein FliL